MKDESRRKLLELHELADLISRNSGGKIIVKTVSGISNVWIDGQPAGISLEQYFTLGIGHLGWRTVYFEIFDKILKPIRSDFPQSFLNAGIMLRKLGDPYNGNSPEWRQLFNPELDEYFASQGQI